MKNRLQEIIRYKTGGRQNDFAAIMGWTPQYLTKLLRGESFGITPLITLIEKLPEINARWFLTGEGDMLEIGKLYNLQREALAQVQTILDLERFIPVMSSDELREFEEAVGTAKMPVFTPVQVEQWEQRLIARKQEQEALFTAAQAKSRELCNQRTAKK